MSSYSTEEGAQILTEVRQHPKRELIETIADTTFWNEEGQGAGMWWHLSQAYALVDALPGLFLDDDALCDEPGYGTHPKPERTDETRLCGAFEYAPPGHVPYRCTELYGHSGVHRATVDGEIGAEWALDPPSTESSEKPCPTTTYRWLNEEGTDGR